MSTTTAIEGELVEEIVEEPSRGRPVGVADVEEAAARIFASTSGRDWVK